MKRHPALQDLARDHHHGLVWAKRLAEAEEGGDPSELADGFLDFWETELSHHFTEEEQVILPVYQRRVELAKDDLVLRMLADHAWFRDAVPALEAKLAQAEEVQATVQEIGERLHEHARMEDRQLFARLEEHLSEEELAEIQERSGQFRREHRGEDTIGAQPAREE